MEKNEQLTARGPLASLGALIMGALFLATSLPAGAALVSQDFGGNDCSGVFTYDMGFDTCAIFYDPDDFDPEDESTFTVLSPVIAKFEVPLGDTDPEILSSLWPTVDGSEWTFNPSASESTAGSWDYEPDSEDPAIRYWTAKGGDMFTLFWEVDDAELMGGGACSGSTVFTLECLQAANGVTDGTWDIEQGLSHLTFFDSDPRVIPIPAAFWLMGSAMIGLIAISRRRRT